MIHSKSVKTENVSPRFIEANDAPHYTKLFQSILKQIDHTHRSYEVKTNIRKYEGEDGEDTYIKIDLRNKQDKDRHIMFYVIKELIDRLKNHVEFYEVGIPNYHHINIWSIIPGKNGYITLNGKFEE